MERFISYAGNYEDIVLYDIFRHIEIPLGGVFIDVGCNDPFEGNVTKAFYDRGWHGINVDPLKDKMALYDCERSRDINICAGVSNVSGKLKYLSANVFSTFNPDNFDSLEQYCIIHKIPYSYEESEVRPLRDIISDHLTKDNDILFLKIDVENYEREVLESIDFGFIKPWIICIEAISQMTGEQYCPWEDLLLGKGYVYDKTVEGNRFYLSLEHMELKKFSRAFSEMQEDYRIYKPLDVNQIDSLYASIGSLKLSVYYRAGYILLSPVRLVRKLFKLFKK